MLTNLKNLDLVSRLPRYISTWNAARKLSSKSAGSLDLGFVDPLRQSIIPRYDRDDTVRTRQNALQGISRVLYDLGRKRKHREMLEVYRSAVKANYLSLEDPLPSAVALGSLITSSKSALSDEVMSLLEDLNRSGHLAAVLPLLCRSLRDSNAFEELLALDRVTTEKFALRRTTRFLRLMIELHRDLADPQAIVKLIQDQKNAPSKDVNSALDPDTVEQAITCVLQIQTQNRSLVQECAMAILTAMKDIGFKPSKQIYLKLIGFFAASLPSSELASALETLWNELITAHRKSLMFTEQVQAKAALSKHSIHLSFEIEDPRAAITDDVDSLTKSFRHQWKQVFDSPHDENSDLDRAVWNLEEAKKAGVVIESVSLIPLYRSFKELGDAENLGRVARELMQMTETELMELPTIRHFLASVAEESPQKAS
eukprot:TRINITY_DN8296_c0_g1_i1.p1 TRINITY_DN8296_c0_g1~~TRINITY_DN8296_c0_g1_i1.p1  ORF type:complete len:427 (-),score=56.21 TRINITY_DN8296_c0_g1_i1:894-2174(-)